MKKAISIALILMLVLSMALTACSSDSSSDDSGSDDSADSSSTTTWAIVYSSTLGDLSFNDSSKAGLDELVATEDFEFDYFECANDATKYESAFLDYADSGNYSLIWSSSTTLSEYCEAVAAVYPDQKFGLYDTTAENPADNTYSMTYNQNDGSYLVGMIAAYATDTGIIGTVGGEDIDVINDFFVGYIEGAQAVNADIKICISYNGSFTDTAKAKELTLAQFAQGADVVYQVASGAGVGVIEACTQEGYWAIGVDSDQSAMYEESDPDTAAAILTSMLKNVGDSIVYAYNKFINDEIVWGTNDALGIAEGGVGYVVGDQLTSTLSDDELAAIEAQMQEIIDGNVVVGTVYGQDADWMSALRDTVTP